MMKKAFFLFMALMATVAISQVNAQVMGGFKMGVDFSMLNMEYDDGSSSADLDPTRLVSPRGGFILDIPVNKFLFVQLAAMGTAKGFRTQVTEEDVENKYIQVIGSVDFPVQFGYKQDLGKPKLFLMAGPVFGYNFYSDWFYKYGDKKWDHNNEQEIGNEEQDTFKHLNIGINGELGVELHIFQFSFFYAKGLSNISPQEGSTYKTDTFGMALAIKFGRAKGE